MNETQQLPISIQPIINYPHSAEVGKTYLMEIDIKQTEDFEKWNYEEEEYPIYFRVDTYCQGDTTPLFKIKIIGEPAVVLHRFGGTYGPAKFLLTAAQKEMEGEIRVTLVNGWGVPLKRLRLENVAVVADKQDDSVIAGVKVISQETPTPELSEFESPNIVLEEKLRHILWEDFDQKINNFRQKLKGIWAKQPIPPLKITYVSASKYQERQDDGEDYIVYPVCVYYSQGAPYLFTYGQTPDDDSGTIIDWYNYRLDRIKELKVLEWNEVNLPNFSLKVCELKTPTEIEKERGEAWGFDFYRPEDVLVIRFERYFHNLYIKGTEPENFFTNIDVLISKYKLMRTVISIPLFRKGISTEFH